MDEVEVGEIALVRHGAPRARDRGEVRGNESLFHGFLERLSQERREEGVLLAGGLVVPFAIARPVTVRLRIRLDRLDEASLVDAGHREHDRHRHHLFARQLEAVSSSPSHEVGIAGRVDHALGHDRFASGLALRVDADDVAVDDDGLHPRPVQHGGDPGFRDQLIRDPFEEFRIEGRTLRLGLGRCGAHRRRALLEFRADAFAVDGARMAIPGEALDADLGDVAAETAVAFEQDRARARTGGGEGRRQTPGTAADDEHVGFSDHRDVTRRLGNGSLHRGASSARSGRDQGLETGSFRYAVRASPSASRSGPSHGS